MHQMRSTHANIVLLAVVLVASLGPPQADAFWLADFVRHPFKTFQALGNPSPSPTSPAISTTSAATTTTTTTTTTTSDSPSPAVAATNAEAAGGSPPTSGPMRNGRSSSSGGTGDDDDFEAKCFVSRGVSLKESPAIYLYSSATHSPETLGCQVDTKITLNYTSTGTGDGNPDDDQLQLQLDDEALRRDLVESGVYNGSWPTYLVVHGFLSSWNGDNWMCQIKDLALNNSQANVLIVDWSGGARPMLPLDYGAAVSNTKYVSQLVAGFLNQLIHLSGQPDGRLFHLIGHSLGAHISGFIGYSVPNVGRITGLDPAGPCFTTSKSSGSSRAANMARASMDGNLSQNRRRLSPESAQFVLALHTDTSLFGLNENCAHYDVYVNGGRKQPKCASLSLSTRFNDLLHLNLQDSLSADIVCAHSFAHRIVETFVDYLGFKSRQLANNWQKNSRSIESQPPEDMGVDGGAANAANAEDLLHTSMAQSEGFAAGTDDTCYPMAYECDDWFAFKSGECGFCRDGDTRCVYTGLSLHQFQRRKLASDGRPASRRQMKRPKRVTDDDKFNDEDEEPGDDINGKPLEPDSNNLTAESRNIWGQHFMKTADGQPTCSYHYQVIVAARKSAVAQINNAKKYYYYLDVPLEQSGRLNDSQGNRLHDRLIQVSHKVEPESSSHQFLMKRYLMALSSRSPLVRVAADQDLEFYTALITFKQAPREQCQAGDQDGATKSDRWQLCKPLNGIREARLWSSSELKLNAVQWVAMNYMSGLDYEQRWRNSHLLYRDFREPIASRAELDESSRASIDSLRPTSQSSGGLVRGAAKKGGCLLSMLDSSDEGKAATNFRCSRSSRELKFAIKLRPNRMRKSAI